MSVVRRRWFLGTVVLLCLLPFIRYRLIGGSPVKIDSEVRYQYVDLGQEDVIRSLFEMPLGNRRLFLVDAPWVFVSNSDFERCWPEPDMRQAHYTMRASIETYPLLFGGYGIGHVVSTERVEKAPYISK